MIFPILTELFLGQTRTIGRPYFDFFLRAFGLPLLLLMGIGPLIAWRRTSVRSLAEDAALADRRRPRRRRRCSSSLGAGSSRPGPDRLHVLARSCSTTIVVELVRGTRVTGSLFELVARNRRRYGGYIVHASIVLLAIGIAGSSAYASDEATASSRRASRSRSPATRSPSAGSSAARARTRTRRAPCSTISGPHERHAPTGINNYFNGDTSREVGIHTNWLRAEDLYVIFDQRDGNTVFFKVLVKPLVNLIWIAGIVFLLGSLVALWPDAREQRRLIARLALAKA